MITSIQYQEMLARTERNQGRFSKVLKAAPAVEEEAELSNQVKDLCRQRGWGLIMARTDKRSTIAEGVHDATIYASEGRVFNFELKDRQGKLSTKQQAWIAQMHHNGHEVHVVRSLQEIMDIIFQPKLSSSPQGEAQT